MHRSAVGLVQPLCRHVRPLVAVVAFCLLPVVDALGQTPVRVNTDQLRSIGGVTTLDREKYFTHSETVLPPTNTNLGNLSQLTGSPAGQNAATGRIATEFDQFIAQPLPEDPSRPGFIDPTALRSRLQGAYRNFVLNGSRYANIRANDNALIVNSGRYGAFFPDYFREPGTGRPRTEPYAEFLTIYLDEVVYGDNAFYPVDPERFHIELLNEPDLHFGANFTRQDYVDFHREVTEGVKATFPQASIGGPSLAVTGFEDNEFVNNGTRDFSRFENRVGNLIEGAGRVLDFYSIHPYERYDVLNNGSFVRAIDNSPGRTDGLLDLIAARDLAVNGDLRDGTPLPISLTEYSSFNRPDSSGGFGNYSRGEQQWDLSRDLREQLLVYLDRPDLVLSATPFVAARDFRQDVPTNAIGDNVFYEQIAGGQWVETIVGQTFRAYAGVSGSYIGIEEASNDLQAVAFRDGAEVYVLLNNLLDTPQAVDLEVLTALGGVQSATIDRLFRQGTSNVFIDDEDVTGGLGSLVLNPQEGSVLTLTLSGYGAFGLETNEEAFFSTDTVVPITSPTGATQPFSIDAPIDDSVLSATLRLTYSRPENLPQGEGFRVSVNGTLIEIPAGVVGIDDGDFGLQSREFDVPIEVLVDGENQLVVDFEGGGGFVAASTLVITSDVNFVSLLPGDYNDDGVVDAADFTTWRDNLGAAAGTLPNDADGGVIGSAQYQTFVANFGSTRVEPPAAATVPEPEALLTVLVTACAATPLSRPLSRRSSSSSCGAACPPARSGAAARCDESP